jgi:predicted amidophosphoribosyltransferase
MVESEFGLCAECWRDLPLISGPVCDACGVPVLVEDIADVAQCDDCRHIARPWRHGRAAMRYRGMGRKLVLALKHGDRQDIAVTAGTWLARAARPLIRKDTLLVPIPLHWSRMVKRRYNQSALLVRHLAPLVHRAGLLDALVRTERTRPLEQATFEERFGRLSGAIGFNPKRVDRMQGRHVLIVDDVMTSGATLAAAAEASHAAGARQVDVLALARVCKDT